MRTTVPPSKSHIAEWLRRRLSDGPVPSEELLREAESLDISPARLRAAGKAIGSVSWKDGYQGRWYWGMPPEEPNALERELGIDRPKPIKVVMEFPERPRSTTDLDMDFFESKRLSNIAKGKER